MTSVNAVGSPLTISVPSSFREDSAFLFFHVRTGTYLVRTDKKWDLRRSSLACLHHVVLEYCDVVDHRLKLDTSVQQYTSQSVTVLFS